VFLRPRAKAIPDSTGAVIQVVTTDLWGSRIEGRPSTVVGQGVPCPAQGVHPQRRVIIPREWSSLLARIGVYQIEVRPGADGMGEVYRARDTKLGRDVAIKILSSDFADDRRTDRPAACGRVDVCLGPQRSRVGLGNRNSSREAQY
jgi:hypothetical protein